MALCGDLAAHELSKRLWGLSDSPIMEIVLYEERGAADETTGLLAASVSCHLASLPLCTDVGAPKTRMGEELSLSELHRRTGNYRRGRSSLCKLRRNPNAKLLPEDILARLHGSSAASAR
jgi:hypothetical protein